MRARRVVRVLAAACLLVLVGSGCTPDPEPKPTPPPVTPTPTETEQEREQRVAYEAAEKSYREFRAEFNLALSKGGAKQATPSMQRTAGGKYLAESVKVLEAYRGLGWKTSGRSQIGYVRRSGYSPTSLILDTCENTASDKIYDSNGKLVGRGEVRTARITVNNDRGTWKLWSGTGKKVDSCAA